MHTVHTHRHPAGAELPARRGKGAAQPWETISARKVCPQPAARAGAGLRTCYFFLSMNAAFGHLLIDLSVSIRALQWAGGRGWKYLFWHVGRRALALRSSMPDYESCKLPTPAFSSPPAPALPLIATHHAGPRSFISPRSSARSIRGAGGSSAAPAAPGAQRSEPRRAAPRHRLSAPLPAAPARRSAPRPCRRVNEPAAVRAVLCACPRAVPSTRSPGRGVNAVGRC